MTTPGRAKARCQGGYGSTITGDHTAASTAKPQPQAWPNSI